LRRDRSGTGRAPLKRGLDLLLVVPGILLISPLLAVLALLIRITSGPPVLFQQQRTGVLGKPFTLLKFRTMNEERDKKGRLLPDGERLSGLGYFLRRTSLDELPTLINVIKGDMSLVGPRPLITDYLERYSPEQMRRHLAKPGITGWNQINGRNALSWEEKFAQDVWYVDNWSLWLDLADERPRPRFPYEWSWSLHPSVLLGTGLLGALYFYGIGPLRRRQGWGPPASPWQILSFCTALVVLLVSLNGPVHDLSDYYLFSVHMVQHLLLSLVAPPLLLLGTPAWLARTLLRPRFLFYIVKRLSRPLPALLLFNLVIALTHWTVVVDLAARSEIAHFSFHAALFGTALLMWMPVASPLIELPRLPYPGQMLYLFAQSLVPTVPASFLTFGSTPLYQVYADAPRTFGISAITDQRLAGLFMKIVGGLVLWSVIAVLFFRWHAQESADGSDALQWRDLEHDLSRMRLSQ